MASWITWNLLENYHYLVKWVEKQGKKKTKGRKSSTEPTKRNRRWDELDLMEITWRWKMFHLQKDYMHIHIRDSWMSHKVYFHFSYFTVCVNTLQYSQTLEYMRNTHRDYWDRLWALFSFWPSRACRTCIPSDLRRRHWHRLRGRCCSAAESCLAPRDLMGSSHSGSSVHGVLQARILQWADRSFCRG